MYDYKKAVQALNYLLRKSGNKMNYMKAIKLLYFAERFHIRKYRRLICHAEYIGMKLGPVQSEVKDIISIKGDLIPEEEKSYYNKYIKKSDNYIIKSIKEIDEDEFSESDIESLNFALRHFSIFNEFQLADITHAYPEWSKYRDLIEKAGRSRFDMDILDFFEDPNDNGLNILKSFSFSEDPYNIINKKKVEGNKEFLQDELMGIF
jgi:uncharacterized phage-associated protein